MKWIKGFLMFGMVMLAHSTVSINDIEAKSQTEQNGKSAKKDKAKKNKAKKNKNGNATEGKKTAAKKENSAKPEKKGLFSSFTSGLKSIGSKVAAGAKSVKDKASSAAECRSGKGEAPGAKLYALAATGTALTDKHIVAAHTSAVPAKAGREK